MDLNTDDSLILAHGDSLQTSDFQNCKIMHLCCFKPLTFVIICYSSSKKLIQEMCTSDLAIMGLCLKTLEKYIDQYYPADAE